MYSAQIGNGKHSRNRFEHFDRILLGGGKGRFCFEALPENYTNNK